MPRPVVGIIGNHYIQEDRYPVHASGVINIEAVSDVAGCLPLVIAADPRFMSVQELMDTCDGFLLTGGRPNVHPERMAHLIVRAMRSPCRWCGPA